MIKVRTIFKNYEGIIPEYASESNTIISIFNKKELCASAKITSVNVYRFRLGTEQEKKNKELTTKLDELTAISAEKKKMFSDIMNILIMGYTYDNLTIIFDEKEKSIEFKTINDSYKVENVFVYIADKKSNRVTYKCKSKDIESLLFWVRY